MKFDKKMFLAKYGHVDVRMTLLMTVAFNGNKKHATKLANDSNGDVRQFAIERLRELQ